MVVQVLQTQLQAHQYYMLVVVLDKVVQVLEEQVAAAIKVLLVQQIRAVAVEVPLALVVRVAQAM